MTPETLLLHPRVMPQRNGATIEPCPEPVGTAFSAEDATDDADHRAHPDHPDHFDEGGGQTADTVTVLGAGIAGLVTAYELEQLGYRVEVLEGSDRLGGRIHTHRFGATPDAPFAELGAMRIPTEHHRALDYLTRLGLRQDVSPFRSLAADENALLGTTRGYVRVGEAARLLRERLRWAQSRHGYREETLLFGAWLSVVVEAIAPAGQRESLHRDLGRQLLGAVDRIDLRPHLGPGGGERVDLHAVFAAHPELRGACSGDLSSFLSDILTETSPDLVRVRGGMGRIVDRLARRIHGPIRREHEVVGLDVGRDGVLVQVRTAGRVVIRRRRYVVCTLPFPVLRRLHLHGFTADKLAAIRAVRYVPATKVAFLCREAFWARGGITGGASSSGGLVRQTYYPAADGDPALGAVLLASYTIGDDADVLSRLPAPARYAAVLLELGRMHPELLRPGMVLDAASVAWGERHRWSGSGCAVYWGLDPDQEQDLRERARAPLHTLYFAGEHCSSTPAWIEGAIESAQRVVDQIALHQAGTPHHSPRFVRVAR